MFGRDSLRCGVTVRQIWAAYYYVRSSSTISFSYWCIKRADRRWTAWAITPCRGISLLQVWGPLLLYWTENGCHNSRDPQMLSSLCLLTRRIWIVYLDLVDDCHSQPGPPLQLLDSEHFACNLSLQKSCLLYRSVIIAMFNLCNYIPHFFHALSLKSYHAGSSWDCDWNGNEICSLTPMFRWFLLFQGVIFDLWTPACSATVSDTITSTRTHLHLLKGKRFGLFCSILFFPHLFLRCQHLNKCRGKLLCLDALWCGNTQKMQYCALPCPLGLPLRDTKK